MDRRAAAAEVAEAEAGKAMQTHETALLFVYGTLRPQLIGRAKTSPPIDLVAGLSATGLATVRGLLVDLGDYPGFVPVEAAPELAERAGFSSLVYGDLLEVGHPQLAMLDDYEECGGPHPLYRRELTTATRLADGAEVACWIYRYCRDITGRVVIASGDYAAYLTGTTAS